MPEFGFVITGKEAESRAAKIVASMSPEQQIGQLISPRVHSDYKSADDPEYTKLFGFIDKFHVGGFIFFQGEVFGQALLVNELNDASAHPLLFSIDAEWGLGMRLFEATTFPNMMAVGASGMEDHAYTVGRVTAAESKAVGVRMVFAPVADLNNNPANPIINVRSFGEDPVEVSRFVRQLTAGLQDGGVLATVKHFPGHGDTAIDSHAALPVLDVTRARLDSLELVPFLEAINAGVASVMVGHLAVPALDPSGVPASLSRPICTELLRCELGFDGLIVSDAMDMNGVQTMFDPDEAAFRAIEAGLDLILTPPDVEAAFRGISDAVRSGRLSQDQIAESAARVLKAKALVGLSEKTRCDMKEVRRTVASAPNVAAALEVARAGITVMPGSRLALDPAAPLLHITLSDTSATTSVGTTFKEAVKEWSTSPDLYRTSLAADPCVEEYSAVQELCKRYETILVTAFVKVRSFSGKIGLPEKHKELLGELFAAGKRVTLVSMGSPYVFSGADEQAEAVVHAYGASDNSQQATAEVVLGGRGAGGKLPVKQRV